MHQSLTEKEPALVIAVCAAPDRLREWKSICAPEDVEIGVKHQILIVMKSIKLIIIATLIAFVSIAQAQKTFLKSDVVAGKTITKWAKEWDLKAFQQTKEVYKKGMTEEAFVQEMIKGFPINANPSFREVFIPYFKYIYTFHARGLTDTQVTNAITGTETTEMINGLSSWNANNPGVLPETLRIPWKKILEFLLELIPIILPLL